jgi:hypothetical protein
MGLITVESHFQHKSPVNVWCGIVDNYLIGVIILENRLTGDYYLKFLQNELQQLLEEVETANVLSG